MVDSESTEISFFDLITGDWSGECPHKACVMCSACEQRQYDYCNCYHIVIEKEIVLEAIERIFRKAADRFNDEMERRRNVDQI